MNITSKYTESHNIIEIKTTKIQESDINIRNLGEENRNLENLLRDRDNEIERLRREFEDREARLKQEHNYKLQGLEDELARLKIQLDALQGDLQNEKDLKNDL